MSSERRVDADGVVLGGGAAEESREAEPDDVGAGFRRRGGDRSRNIGRGILVGKMLTADELRELKVAAGWDEKTGTWGKPLVEGYGLKKYVPAWELRPGDLGGREFGKGRTGS